MNISQSSIPLRMRISAIFFGMAFFLWLPLEDSNETIVIFFAFSIAVWLALALLRRKNTLTSLPIHYFILTGILAGAAVTPLTLLLMAFKTGLHAHTVSDYSYQQIISIIYRTPIWVVGGVFISMGLGIWVKNRPIQPESYHAAKG